MCIHAELYLIKVRESVCLLMLGGLSAHTIAPRGSAAFLLLADALHSLTWLIASNGPCYLKFRLCAFNTQRISYPARVAHSSLSLSRSAPAPQPSSLSLASALNASSDNTFSGGARDFAPWILDRESGHGTIVPTFQTIASVLPDIH